MHPGIESAVKDKNHVSDGPRKSKKQHRLSHFKHLYSVHCFIKLRHLEPGNIRFKDKSDDSVFENIPVNNCAETFQVAEFGMESLLSRGCHIVFLNNKFSFVCSINMNISTESKLKKMDRRYNFAFIFITYWTQDSLTHISYDVKKNAMAAIQPKLFSVNVMINCRENLIISKIYPNTSSFCPFM